MDIETATKLVKKYKRLLAEREAIAHGLFTSKCLSFNFKNIQEKIKEKDEAIFEMKDCFSIAMNVLENS